MRYGRAAALQMLAMPMGIAVPKPSKAQAAQASALHRIPSRMSLTAHFNDSADYSSSATDLICTHTGTPGTRRKRCADCCVSRAISDTPPTCTSANAAAG
jgi:hypothetical protein